MDGPSLVALVLVVIVGGLSMLKNRTAAALVANYAIVMGFWLATGERSLHAAILADYLVLIVIFTKQTDIYPPSPGALGWAKDWWRQLTWWDKAVLWLFLPSWFTYAVILPPVWAYWIAWVAGVLQLFAAGGEAVERWRRGRALAKAHDPTDLSMRRVGMAVRGC